MNPICRLIAIAVVLGAGCATSASADVVFNNLAATPTGSTGNVGTYGPDAQSFTTGAGSMALTDVKLLLSRYSDPVGTATIGLYSDGPGICCSLPAPTSLLQTLGTVSDTALTTSPGTYDFTLGTPYALSAGTRYWIEISTTDGSTVAWSTSNDLSGVGVASSYLFHDGGTSLDSSLGRAHQMQVQVGGVPEPSGLAIVGAGLVALTLTRRRRQV